MSRRRPSSSSPRFSTGSVPPITSPWVSARRRFRLARRESLRGLAGSSAPARSPAVRLARLRVLPSWGFLASRCGVVIHQLERRLRSFGAEQRLDCQDGPCSYRLGYEQPEPDFSAELRDLGDPGWAPPCPSSLARTSPPSPSGRGAGAAPPLRLRGVSSERRYRAAVGIIHRGRGLGVRRPSVAATSLPLYRGVVPIVVLGPVPRCWSRVDSGILAP